MKKTLLMTVTTLLSLVVLSGCYRMDMTMKFNADDTVDGSLAVGLKEEALESLISMSGGSEDEFWGEMSDEMTSAEASGAFSDAKVTSWKDDGYEGRKFTFEGASLKDMNTGGPGDASTVRHENGEFTVALDMRNMNVTDTADDTFGMTASPVLRLEFEFPGKVLTAPGGAIDGNKVVFLFDSKTELAAIPDTLHITALDKGEDGDTTAVALVIGLLVIAGLTVGGLLLVESRAGSREAAIDDGSGEDRASAIAPDEPNRDDNGDWDQYDEQ